ncbi:MAG: hypothetical protein MUC49_14525 [Raineya sp.]|jgi:hypothetical protein|nr:hypothetical protein [Raineya sp.]
MYYTISNQSLLLTSYENLINTSFFRTYNPKKKKPEQGTYYYRVYELMENIYKNGLSEYHYNLLQKGEEDFFIEGSEILKMIDSLKTAIKSELRWRKEAQRPYLKHTLCFSFEGEDLYLNVKDDIDDIRIGQLIGYSKNLEKSYLNNEKIYFCRYEPPPSDW